MEVKLHPHTELRLNERGAVKEEVIETVLKGEKFPAKYGRTGFRLNFTYDHIWMGKRYNIKQIEAYAVQENNFWLVITIIVKYF